MLNLDRRTRSDADVRTVDFVEFHEKELPSALAGPNGECVARAMTAPALPALAFEVDGAAYSYRPLRGGLEITRGAGDAAAVARCDAHAFSDFVQDVRSAVGLIIGDAVRMTRGAQQALIDWEPVFRAALDGRPVYQPGSLDFRDRNGAPLDLRHSFSCDDAREEMAHFLREAGFLILRGVFAPSEMARVHADIDRALPSYTRGDGRSWWARTRAGEHRAVRLQYFQEHSATVRALLDDPRFLSIADIAGNGYRQGQRREGNAIEALVKPLDVVEGISDVTWHKDCSLGRHSYQCCGVTTGISVTRSDERSGQLCVVAGSHRASLPLKGLRDDLDLPRIGLPTEPGDVTVHLSCTFHMSIPPQASERRVMYTGFALPPRAHDTQEARDALRHLRERAPAKALALKQTSIGDDPEADRRRGFDRRGLA